ncbi:type 1 glutamine amidotransferase [Halovenus halobia]|uniref:type 1 glutamine amidotransferase n=1 Tax=Halovenus halobia TaxID=3396622 RepID=UPI003F57E6EA
MSRLRIALLNAAHDGDHTRRNFRRELDADLVEYNVTDGDLPDSFEFDGAVVTGSRASVYWDEPWIGALKRWVGDAIETGMPFLGVCYGHQLLADVLGGRVAEMDEYEIGYREIEHDGDSLLFDGIDEHFTAFTTHSDCVEELPPGAELLATNDYGIHGFRHGSVFTVQFHPEYDMETARKITDGKDQLSAERRQSVLDGVTDESYAAACRTKKLFENFTAFVRENREGTAVRSSAAGD